MEFTLEKIIEAKGEAWVLDACMNTLLGNRLCCGGKEATAVTRNPRTVKPKAELLVAASEPKRGRKPNAKAPAESRAPVASDEAKAKVRNALANGELTSEAIATVADLSIGYTSVALRALMADGTVVKIGGGKRTSYKLAAS